MAQSGWSKSKRKRVEKAFYEFLSECYVNSKDKGRICLGDELYDGQRRFITEVFDALEQDIHDIYCLKSRQLGISTIVRAMIVFFQGVFSGQKAAIVFDTDFNKIESRSELVAMISDLPDEIEFPRIKSDNRQGLTLENGSKTLFMSAGVKKSKGSGALGRSVGLSLAALSELCSYDNDEGLEAFENSLSDINPDRLYIRESTARGFNSWHSMWVEARKDPTHKRCIFLGWWSKPSQAIPTSHPDFERYGLTPPSDKELKKIKEVREKYGHEITPEQLAWIRRKMDPSAQQEGDAKPDFGGDSFRVQEQPWCVTRETRVGTARGILRIDELREGDITARGKAIRAGATGRSIIWRAKTRLGYSIRGTGNHPLIDIEGNEIRIDQSSGSCVKLQPPKFADEIHSIEWREGPVNLSVRVTPDLARFVGLFMGDGSASNGYGRHGHTREVSIACDRQDDDIVMECARLFESVFDVTPTVSYQKEGRGWVQVRSGAKGVFETIQKIGLTRNDTGKTSRRVHVPEFIWRSPRHVVKEFLSGLFEADGFNAYDTNRVALFSKYPDFISDIQKLLLGFGITSRAVSMCKKASDGHFYTGNQLELRAAEAIKFNEEIGFLSDRKIARAKKPEYKGRWKNRRKPEIELFDTVSEVVCENVIEEVFNLTVEGEHLFDANGILTHNTEEDAFQMTGSVFFNPEKLTEQANKNVSQKFKTYMFSPGIEFTDMRVYPAPNARSVELKVWEEPDQDGVYVVAADVAYGRSDKNDRSSIQVLRCYADGVDQVAEYAHALIGTRPFAWVTLALAGWYAGQSADVYLIVEQNGPGSAVWDEINHLKTHLPLGYQPREVSEKGLGDIFRNVRTYVNIRPDSLTGAKSLNWTTAHGTGFNSKIRLMERCRDFTENGMLRVRSLSALEEMRSVTREGDAIGAAGSKKDDRVVSLALGVRCWEDRVRRNMTARNRTRQVEQARRTMTVSDMTAMYNHNMFQSFLAGKNAARVQQQRSASRHNWRYRGRML